MNPIVQNLALASIPLLVGYAVALIRGHVKSSAAADALTTLTTLAQGAATAALSGTSLSAAGVQALDATVTRLRTIAATEVAYLEGFHGVPKASLLLQGIAAQALASVQVAK